MNLSTLAKSTSPDGGKDGCMTFHDVSWEQFEAIEAAFAEIRGVKFFYLDRILQIMTVLPEHEIIKKTLCMLVEAYMRATGIRFYAKGGPTLGNRELGGRKEPDDSYSLPGRRLCTSCFFLRVLCVFAVH